MGYPAQLFDNRLSSLVLLINPWAIQPKNMRAVLKHYSPAQRLLARLFFLHWLGCPGFICPETVSGWLPAVPGCWAIQPIAETPPCFTVNCRHFTAVFFLQNKTSQQPFCLQCCGPLTASSAVSTGAQNHCTSKALCWPDSSSACSPESLHLPIWSFCSHRRKSCTACTASAHLCSQQTSHTWAVEWLNFKKMCFKGAPKKTKQTYK